jgi:elongation factor Tu
MAAVDAFVPEPERDLDKPFLMPIEDVFSITGRGTVVTGKVEQGVIHTGDEVEIVGIRTRRRRRARVWRCSASCSMRGRRGQHRCVVAGHEEGGGGAGSGAVQAGQHHAAHEFEAQVYVLTQEEGGRHKPFFSNYRPQFFFRTTDITGTIELPEGTEMCMPGDNTVMTVELIHPIAMDEGLRFAIREGGRTVGAGRVTKIIK